jgi:hypothetical protein
MGVWLVWGLGLCALYSSALFGCATAEAGTQVPVESDTSRVAAPAVTTEPEQVVQRMVPAGAASAAAVAKRAASTPGAPRRTAEAITSKHLEAELNRLEAELGK